MTRPSQLKIQPPLFRIPKKYTSEHVHITTTVDTPVNDIPSDKDVSHDTEGLLDIKKIPIVQRRQRRKRHTECVQPPEITYAQDLQEEEALCIPEDQRTFIKNVKFTKAYRHGTANINTKGIKSLCSYCESMHHMTTRIPRENNLIKHIYMLIIEKIAKDASHVTLYNGRRTITDHDVFQSLYHH